MAGIENSIVYGKGFKLQPSLARDISDMQRTVNDVSKVNYTGNPEGNISANPSSLCHNPSTGDLYVKASGTGNTGWALIPSSANDLHVSKYIVNSIPNSGGNYTTIAAAYADAVSSGVRSTVFVMPGVNGVYAEDFSLSPDVNLTAFSCDGTTPTIFIDGKMTANFSGACTVSGFSLLNTADVCLAMTGSSSCQVNLKDCTINCAGNFFSISSSNASAVVDILNCEGDISGTQAYFNFTGGGVRIKGSTLGNSINSAVVNAFVNSDLELFSSTLDSQVTVSGTGAVSLEHSSMIVLNNIALNCEGTVGNNVCLNSRFDTGTATAITIGAGSTLKMADCSIISSNANAISGAGTLDCTPISFLGSSSTISAGTVNSLPFLPSTSGGTVEGFSAYLSATATAVTGDGTFFPIIYDSTLFNSGNYNTSTGIYTAPTTGLYHFDFTTTYSGGDALTVATLTAANGSAYSARHDQTAYNGNFSIQITTDGFTIPMTAGDTIGIEAYAGGTNKNVDIAGAAPTVSTPVVTTFSGFRVAGS